MGDHLLRPGFARCPWWEIRPWPPVWLGGPWDQWLRSKRDLQVFALSLSASLPSESHDWQVIHLVYHWTQKYITLLRVKNNLALKIKYMISF